MQIYEIKETLTDSTIIENIYQIQKLIKDITKQTELIININQVDFNYINIVLDKTKINLQKIYQILNLEY